MLKSRTFNEQKQHFKHFQDLKIRVLKFKGFQDVYKPCLKKTLTAILSGLNALINLRIFKLTTSGALF